jgi:hypothetical protein
LLSVAVEKPCVLVEVPTAEIGHVPRISRLVEPSEELLEVSPIGLLSVRGPERVEPRLDEREEFRP